MRFARATLIATGAAAALSLGVSGIASAASGTWTVTAGSAAAGTTAAFTGTSSGAITLKDATTGTTLSCASGTAGGSTTVGSGLAGTGVAAVNGASTTWSTCTGPLGLTFAPTGTGSWSLDAASYANGVTTGSLDGITASIKNTGGVSCSFTVTGSVPGTYTNATQTLTLSPSGSNLLISNVSGCLGLVKSGDSASIAANYVVAANDPANGPVTITSP